MLGPCSLVVVVPHSVDTVVESRLVVVDNRLLMLLWVSFVVKIGMFIILKQENMESMQAFRHFWVLEARQLLGTFILN